MYIVTTKKNLLVGDFNAEISKFCLESFFYQHELKNPVKEKTCFKNVSNLSSIDLFLTYSALSFQQTETVSTGLSDSLDSFKNYYLEKQTKRNSLQRL